MKVEDNISSPALSIERERKGYVENGMLKLIFVFAFRIDDLVIVGESWRTNEHEAVLLDESARDVFFYLVSSWLFGIL